MIWSPALSAWWGEQGCSPGWGQGWAGPAAFEDGATLPRPWSPQEAGGPAWRKSLLSMGCCPSF